MNPLLEGRRVLFISYNGMLDPLGQTQVLPYLRELAKRGVNFTLLSFERGAALKSNGSARCDELRRQLAGENIEWHWLRYHKTPSIPATGYDVAHAIQYASRLVKQNKIEMVHARSHIPATIAVALKKRFGIKVIFDIRGLMAEEYADAGHWERDSISFRLTKYFERRALRASDAIVTLTEKIWPILRDWEGLKGREVIHEVVPCCADLDLFKFNRPERDRLRAELGLDDRFTLVYCGSIDGWYMTDQMADFFAQLLRHKPSAHFLWLTPLNHERIRTLMESRGISGDSYTIRSVTPQQVPSFLSASDVGLAFIRPCFSKMASSPTKNAEYLACGLPLVINAGVGDSDALINDWKTGALVQDLTEPEYGKAIATMDEMIGDQETVRAAVRNVAEDLFDLRKTGVERYERLYERVLHSSLPE
jgi:glycosyltransferase involved in cell wall biosynthesis